MEYKVNVGISHHHVHLTKETYETLFNEPIQIDKELHQIGEFASKEFVALKGPKGLLKKVRVVGPFRHYNQVEISKSDAYFLGLNPPVRKSGDTKNSEDIIVIGPNGQVFLKSSCILAERHVHINTKDQEKYGVLDGELVKVRVEGPRSATLDAHVKVSENGFFEFHIDRDEGNALLLENGDEGTLIIE